MRKKMLQGLALSALFLGVCAPVLHAQTFSPVAPARSYNVFTRDSVMFVGAHVDGPVATGGELYLCGKTTVAMRHTGAYPFAENAPGNYSLLIGGAVVYSSMSLSGISYVNNGDLRLGDATGSKLWDKDPNNATCNLRLTRQGSGFNTYNSNPSLQIQKKQSASSALQPHGVNFTDAFDSLQYFSSAIAQYDLAAPGVSSRIVAATIPNAYHATIALTPGKANLINLTGAQLEYLKDKGSIQFNPKPSLTTPVVFNITDNGNIPFVTPKFSGLNDGDGAFILWNFATATTVHLDGDRALYGTILAPKARINKADRNNVNGQLIGKSVRIFDGEIHYYPFLPTLPTGGTPLPLSGLQLAVQSRGQEQLLTWATLNERDMVAFTVERSVNGRDFHPLEVVYSLGNGDHQYQFQDRNRPAADQLFYRIKGVDRAGSISYSNVASVRNAGLLQEIKVGPNPFTSYIRFTTGVPADCTYRILDASGRTRKAGQAAGGEIWQLDNLPPATYWLLLQDAHGQTVLRQQLIKQ